MTSSCWLVVPMLGMLFASADALADSTDDARAHIAKATRAHKEAHYEDARVELEAAFALDPKPDLLYAIAQVEAKLGRCDEATEHYRRFAATQSDPRVARVVEQAITACVPAVPADASSEPAAAPPSTASERATVAARSRISMPPVTARPRRACCATTSASTARTASGPRRSCSPVRVPR